MNVGQTGGSKKNWSFDISQVDSIAPIRDALVHHDVYFEEESDNYNTLSIVMDRIVADLPEELREPVRLVYLEGRSFRSAGRTLNIDHKTVKSRVEKGIDILKTRLVESVWVAEMLRGYLPADEIEVAYKSQGGKVVDILNTLKGTDEQK